MSRTRLVSVLLLLIITVAGLAVAESIVRYVHPETTRAAQLSLLEFQRHPGQHPDAEFHHSGDDELRLTFPVGGDPAPRVMIVGDSFAAGHGVGEAGRFGSAVVQALEPQVDVLAGASYSPVIYRNIVRRGLSLAEYRLVAVFVDQTDPVDDLIYQTELIAGDARGTFDLELMSDRQRLVGETLDRLEAKFHGWRGIPRRSAIVNLMQPVTILGAIPPANPHYDYIRLSLARWNLTRTFQQEPTAPITEAMETLLFRHLDQLIELCRSRGTEVLLAANPWEYQLADGRGDNRLERLLRQRYAGAPGVTVLELTAAFAEQPDPSQLFLPGGDIHWNAAGHALVAEQLTPALLALTR